MEVDVEEDESDDGIENRPRNDLADLAAELTATAPADATDAAAIVALLLLELIVPRLDIISFSSNALA